MAVEIDGDARAYPVQMLIWHEIVNDTVGGIPVAVTYCPLCNSAVAYDRRVGERVLDFGTSGLLWNSALVMYDRQTESLWSHFTGDAIAGVLTGTELDTFPVATVSWRAWRDAHPDGLVLSRDTGFDRDYGREPVSRVRRPDEPTVPVRGRGRRPLHRDDPRGRCGDRRQRRCGAAGRRCATRASCRSRWAGTTLTVWWQPGTASALDEGDIVDGDDIGRHRCVRPRRRRSALTFTAGGDGFVDTETGSTWNLFGRRDRGAARRQHSWSRWRTSTRSGSPGRRSGPTPLSQPAADPGAMHDLLFPAPTPA